MTVDVRPDDLDLLRAAAARLRRDWEVPLVFGGLRDDQGVPVRLALGEVTSDLSTITIKPSLGLGGKTWVSRRPAYVRDYGTSLDITHEYDRQILGERVTFLAVVPIVVRDDVRGLLYAGTRGSEQLPETALEALVAEARKVSGELEVRDEVDRRVRLSESVAAAGPETAELQRLREAYAQMRVIARETADPRTRERLEALLARDVPGEVTLTARQLDVVSLVAAGCRNSEIADRLGLGPETVKSYLRSAMARLGARSRHEAVAAARRHGLLP
ncbi:helix-turn-helix transcriptional regulator [Aeromicrobium chenweiae]|uniref:Helix-turn-helix transcriptional regulator n=1 Tax=Aeromicrobium chenweiae TaxID=2079793 RepID=A0A2S0WI35_9ACTN|nr:LuxR C-terminal-related transcriptional regulator [Aeromicrobium chenweiae]AWB90988.1 helix-turn-helix transcriptional regulator [Aeromicrobium chenweiae]TGN31891.1 response regulator transcription factor [Aeromicrobium chenweiae]